MLPTEDASLAPCLIYRLVVCTGTKRGRSVTIRPGGLLIGRDSDCHVRSDHAFLSRLHARVWSDHGSVFVTDLDSTNGTLVNNRPVKGGPVELKPGDRIQIGPLKFILELDPRSLRHTPNEHEIAGWLGPESEDDTAGEHEDTVYDVPASPLPMKRDVIEGTLVLTPVDPGLMSGSNVDLLREELSELLEKSAPRRVVVNLKLVPRLSNAAVGLLVAHHIRLDRMGGGLRLCEPHARVAELLNQMRLPLLLDVFATEDDAVLSSWKVARD